MKIFGDDSPFRRTMATLGQGLRDAVEVKVTAETSEAKAEIASLGATSDAEVKIKADASDFYRTLAEAEGVGRSVNDITVKIKADSSGFVRAAGEARAASAAAGSSISSFGQESQRLQNILQGLAYAGIGALIAAIAPLTAILGVATAGVGALGAGFGLLVAAVAPSIMALGKHKQATQELQSAQDQQKQASQQLSDAEENLRNAEEQAAQSVAQAAQQRADAARNLRRTEVQAEQSIADARERTAQAARGVEDAERQRAQGIAQAIEQYRQAEENLKRTEEDAAQRIQQAYRQRAEAQRNLAQAERQADEQIADARRNLVRAEQQADQEIADARRNLAQAEQQYQQARQDAFEQIAQARQSAEQEIAQALQEYRSAEEQTAQAERDLQQARENALEATDRLKDAQQALNQALRDEPREQAQAQLNVEQQRLNRKQLLQEIADTQQRLQEARAEGDTEQARQLELQLQQLRLNLKQNQIDLSEAQETANRVKKHGSDALNQARDQLAQALAARDQAREQEREAQQHLDDAERQEAEARRGIAKARADAARTLAQAEEQANRSVSQAAQQVASARRALAQAQRQGAQSVADARRELARAQEQGAQSVADARRQLAQANAAIRQTARENARSIQAAREQAEQAFRGISEARSRGTEQVAQAEQQLADAVKEQHRTIQQAHWQEADAQRELARATQSYRDAQTQAAEQVRDAQKQVARAQEQLAEAQQKVDKAAQQTGAHLTAAQQALLTSLQGFKAAFLDAFGPAGEILDRLLAHVLDFGKQALPYVGGITTRIARSFSRAINGLLGQVAKPRQLEIFRDFFERLPQIVQKSTDIAGKLIISLFNMLEPALPVFQKFLNTADKAVTHLLDWSRSRQGQSTLRDFFQSAIPFAQNLWKAVKRIVGALWDFSQSKGVQLFLTQGVLLISRIVQLLPGLAPVFRAAGSVLWLVNKIINGVAAIGRRLPKIVQHGLQFAVGAALISFVLFRRRVMRLLKGIFFGFNAEKEASMANMGLFERVGRSRFGRLAKFLGTVFLAPFRFIRNQLSRLAGFLRRVFGRETERVVIRSFRDMETATRRGARSIFADVRAFVGRIPEVFWRALRGIPGYVLRVFRSVASGALRPLANLAARVARIFAPAARWLRPLLVVFERYFGGRGAILTLLRGFAGRLGIGAIFGPEGMVLQLLASLATPLSRWAHNFGKTIGDALNISWIVPYLERQLKRFVGPRIYNMLSQVMNYDLGKGLWNLAKSLGNWISGVFKWVGEMLMYGWLGGIWKHAKEIYNSLVKIAKAAWSAVKSALHISSPSKDMQWLGRMMSLGIARGIEDEMPGVILAAQRLAYETYKALSSKKKAPVYTIRPLPQTGIYRPLSSGPTYTERPIPARHSGIGGYMPDGQRGARPQNITIPVSVGGRHLEDIVVEIVNDRARVADRRRYGSAVYPY